MLNRLSLHMVKMWLAMHYCFISAGSALVRRDERGEITEKTIIVAAFAIITLAVCGIIAVKLTNAANAINVNPNPLPGSGP
jgi:hypothetical protein